MGNGDQPAFSGAFCPESIAVYLAFKLAREIIGKSRSGKRILIIIGRKAGVFVGDKDAHMRRGSKGVSLNMVYGQRIEAELVESLQRLVRRIALAVNGRAALLTGWMTA